MKEVIYTLNISNDPYFKAASVLMTEIMTVSRLKYKPDLIKLKSVCPLPEFSTSFNKTFGDIVHEQAVESWKNYAHNSNINILWSGGIDSTLLLVAMLQNRPNGHKITVFCNLNSFNENAEFYKHLLSLDCIEFKSSSIIPSNEPHIILTGELADQVFGSDLMYRIVRQFSFESLYSPFEAIIPHMFTFRCGEPYGKLLFNRYKPIINEAPFQIKTAFDFIWWWNFTQKWQFVKYRKKSLMEPVHTTINFFEHVDFQIWSVFNHHLKIGKNIESYKMPAKELIYKYDKNETYYKKKKKFGSPFGAQLYFFTLFDDGTKLHTWDECNQLIQDLSLVKN